MNSGDIMKNIFRMMVFKLRMWYSVFLSKKDKIEDQGFIYEQDEEDDK